jgi:hypothetical protein
MVSISFPYYMYPGNGRHAAPILLVTNRSELRHGRSNNQEASMPQLSNNLTFISDPGHAWLQVPIWEIATLGIEAEISNYSYINGRYAYHSASS